MLRKIRFLVVLALALVTSSSALASALYYEFLTGDQGQRVTTVDGSTTTEAVAGLPGGGYVNGTDPLSYTHTFSPSVAVGADAIEGAWLHVALVDDFAPLRDALTPNEMAYIEIDGNLWQGGQAVLNVLHGSLIVSTFTNPDNQFTVTVSSANGSDFRVAGSLFRVNFRSAPPIPEPSAVAGFGIGALLVGGALARRRVA